MTLKPESMYPDGLPLDIHYGDEIVVEFNEPPADIEPPPIKTVVTNEGEFDVDGVTFASDRGRG